MKKLFLVLPILTLVCCVNQTINTGSTFLDGHSFNEVWMATIRAVNDIDFTIDSLDKEAGFIGAESGRYIGQDAPPRLSIMISESRGRVYVDCKVLQKEQYIDIFGHGKRTIRKFMTALNLNLNHEDY